MKSLLNITPVILFAVALMQLYRANMELKYNYEAFAWQMKNKTEQLEVSTATLFRRTYPNVQKTNCRTWSSQFPLDHGAVSSKVTQ
jgi:hypothetical protein